MSIDRNSPSGKQYIDNAKHKLIMKIPLDSVDLAVAGKNLESLIGHAKKLSQQSASMEKTRQWEDDLVLLGQMTNLAKNITVAHPVISSVVLFLHVFDLSVQHLDDSIKDTIQLVNKHLIDESNARRSSPEPPSHSIETNAMNIQLTINTPSVFLPFDSRRESCVFRERTETIDVLFLSSEYQSGWKKSFLEAKKALCKTKNFRSVLHRDFLF
jgi:hypothetical protein